LLETDSRAARILLDTDAFAVGDHRIPAELFLYRLVEDHVQAAAMDTDFRKGVSGEFSAVLAINQLPKTIEEGAVAVFDPGLEQCVAQAERIKLTHGMWKQRDADPKLLDLRCAFIDPTGNAAFRQIESERQPANAAADNRYFHSVTPIRGVAGAF
jgi:hypothetical protein